jgi:PAS domain S-box-containing protein
MVTRAQSTTPIVYVNDAFTALTGYTAEESVGHSPAFLQGPATDASVLDRLKQDLTAGRVFEGQAINYRKDGSSFVMHWRVMPVCAADRTPVYYVAVQQKAPAA